MVVTKPSGEPTASIISIVPLRRKQQDIPKCCKISTRPHDVYVPDFRKHHCENLKAKPLNSLYLSTFHVTQTHFSRTTEFCHMWDDRVRLICRDALSQRRTKALGHLQTRHVTTEKQIRYARTWPCEMSEGYHSPAAPIYSTFHGHLRNNSVR